MPLPAALARRAATIALIAVSSTALVACTGSGLVRERTQGRVITEDAQRQIRPGVSRDLVEIVLGTPQITNTFGGQQAYYYVETEVTETAFGLTSVQDRTVLAVYFGGNDRVADKVVYGLEDGRVVAIESTRTQSFGQDQTFVGALLESI